MADKRQPWWGPPTTAKAALDDAGLNWEVRKADLFAKSRATYVEVPDQYALMGPHNHVFGVVGEKYEPRQNAVLSKWATGFGRLVGAWAFRQGGIVGFTVSATGLDAGDVGACFLHVLNHHSGGGVEVHAAFEDERYVSFVLPPVHVRTLSTKHATVNDAVLKTEAALHPDVVRLQKSAATPRSVSALYEALWSRPADGAGQKAQTRWKNRKDEIWSVWQDSDDDSEWGAFMALLDWAQWHRNFRGSAGDERANDALRGEEILFGPTREISDKAFKHLTKGKR